MKAIIIFFFVIFPIFAFSQENDGNTNPKQWIENKDVVRDVAPQSTLILFAFP